MSHAKNKVEWCFKKAEKEMGESGRHRGLLKIKQDKDRAKSHVIKAEHNLKLMIHLKKDDFSDWCGPAAFYSVYHSLLAILSKFGYESRNQECTFAVIYSLIEDKKIDLDKSMIEKVAALDVKESGSAATITNIREQYQYGTKLSLEDKIYEELLGIVKKILGKTKEIIEE
ncbi:MAG: HEPN domain-containing protein [Candidatus Woesearchaeota archaeon]|nr:HEPN domain-containing protein [Candidatus Woesearchaeota archaeon]